MMNFLKALPLAGSIIVLAGCGGTGVKSSNNVGEVTLSPGESTTCITVPCAVYFMVPPGSGSYAIAVENYKVGEYPAGQKAFLGSYWSKSNMPIDVLNSDYKRAFVTILGRP